MREKVDQHATHHRGYQPGSATVIRRCTASSPGCALLLILVLAASRLPGWAAGLREDRDGGQEGPFHYTGRYCTVCHVTVPAGKRDSQLKFGGDYNLLCQCHTPRHYVHPVDVIPSRTLSARIPPDLPMENDRLTCLTCHDIHHQCSQRRFERNSLRGAPYPRRYDFCYRCHDPSLYEAFNPHIQKDEAGRVQPRTCLYCHASVPDPTTDTYASLQYLGDLVTLCQRCHRIDGKHSGNFDHMVVPSANMLAVMQQMETKFGIILPLDAGGKLTCITCHNPHAKGVIPDDRASAKGADAKYRHRLPERLCIECHRM
jgi:hypothetical protein